MKKAKAIQKLMLVTALCSMTGFAVASHAASPPNLIANCWTESGQDLEDGQFSVSLETKSISKTKLVSILNSLSGVNIEPMGYPLIFGDQMFIYVRAVDHSVPPMDRLALKEKVQAELEAIAAISLGVSASCNYRSYPAPAVGVRN